MKGYKGFDKDLKCRDLQYEVGKKTVIDGDIELCKRGIHFCENPHDVFNYYAPGENNRFAVVKAEDVSDERNDDDSKRVCKMLTVNAEISVFEICKIAVSTFFENFGFKKKIESADTNNAGDCGAAQAGDYGAAQAGYKGAARAGDYGAAQAGDYGAAQAGNYGAAQAGDYGAAQAGNCGAAQAGNCGAAQAGNCGAARAGDCGAARAGNCGAARAGDCGAARAGYKGAAQAGDCGAAQAGDYGAAQAGNCGAARAGDYGAAQAGDCGAALVGNSGRVKGGYGCVLVARDIEYSEETKRYEVTDWACGIVDGKDIKPDTWYRLKDGKLVEDND